MQINWMSAQPSGAITEGLPANMPAGYADAFARAAQKLASTILNNMTINVVVSLAPLPSDAISTGGPANGQLFTYAAFVAALKANESSPAGKAFAASLPAQNPTIDAQNPNGKQIFVSSFLLKAWGLMSPTATPDVTITISSTAPYNPNADLVGDGSGSDLVNNIIAEVTHGFRGPGLGVTGPNAQPADFMRYAAPGVLDALNPNSSTYLSFNNGVTSVYPWGTSATGDPSDFQAPDNALGSASPVMLLTKDDIAYFSLFGLKVANPANPVDELQVNTATLSDNGDNIAWTPYPNGELVSAAGVANGSIGPKAPVLEFINSAGTQVTFRGTQASTLALAGHDTGITVVNEGSAPLTILVAGANSATVSDFGLTSRLLLGGDGITNRLQLKEAIRPYSGGTEIFTPDGTTIKLAGVLRVSRGELVI